ncbi:MAG: glutamine synthetase [Alphaproteobacteria bacterium]|nr:glutamine synthetase [Alphaproteobacteria bacterium]
MLHNPSPEANRAAALAHLQQYADIHPDGNVKLGVVDIDGVMAGKYVSMDKFRSALAGGFGFCDVVFGWDSADALYDNTRVTGWHHGYGDAQVRLVPESWRLLPFESPTIFVQGELDGRHSGICPRRTLARVLEQGAAQGMATMAGFEYEFLVLDETMESLQSRHFQSPRTFGTGGFGYSVIRNSAHAEFYQGLLALCREMKMPLEGLHEETGPGMLEAALTVAPALQASDEAAAFKTFAKVYAQQRQMTLSFMAKWSEKFSGQGGHVHISLWRDGKNLFHDPQAADGMSAIMLSFIAGLQAKMAEIMALAAPTINSYRRLVPGYWAPTSSQWAIDNRTAAIRAIPGSSKSTRVEFRLPGADSNPYLALAGALAAGFHGIAQKLTPPAAITGNGYLIAPRPEDRLPRTLWDAAQSLRGSAMLRAALGDDLVDHFAATREWEEREFQKFVTDYELKRYLEII